ncbi:MAG: hypothetical protein KF819_30585 [Labilithrix sp.]|nr:hypothetical protein [Labilithrix sp.]
MTRSTLLACLAAFIAVACSSASPSDPAVDPGPAPSRECESIAATRCDGLRVQTCEARGDGSAWSAPVECPGDQACRDDACADPTARQITQAKSIGTLVDDLAEWSAWHEAVDAAAVKSKETRAVLKGDGADATFFGATWRVMNVFRQGHQSLYSLDRSVCGKAMATQQTSRFGVCGRPSSSGGIAVTFAAASNKLGLKAGDVVVSAGDDSGDAMFEAAYLRPVCGGVFPAKSGRRYAGAASFFGTVPAGTKLSVRGIDGSTRDVTVPTDADATATDCTDPFGRDRAVYAEAKTRPDGVAVIRLPSFFPFDKQFPQNPTQAEVDQLIADYQSAIVEVFDTVKSAPAIIWDARGNTGGITTVGLAIVGGFASARATPISYCRTRSPGSSPPSFESDRYALYDVTPGGPFAYAGKVAVLTDGLGYSAGDYFPFAAARASNAPVVGSASAGAFGGGNGPIELEGPPKLVANYDPTACFDAAANTPLEGNPLPPTVAVEYDPQDLAAGKDTILERAVKELGF